jgi:hypothetical protein
MFLLDLAYTRPSELGGAVGYGVGARVLAVFRVRAST